MKKRKISIIVIIVAMCIFGTFVFANNTKNISQKKEFFSVDKENASVGDIVTMTLDLSQINYDEFVLTIQADKQIIDNSQITEQEDSEDETTIIEKGAITLKKESDVTMKLFASKKDLSTDEIKLCFVVPETMNIGDKININATIEEINNASDNEETLNEDNIEESIEEAKEDEEEIKEDGEENEVEEEEIEEKVEEAEQTESEKNSIQEITITITIVEKSKKENTMDANAINLENAFKEQKNTSKTTENTQNASTSNKSKTASSSNTAETYKGSSNKYLSNIEIDGYKLTPEFNITNTTYFLEVESDITSLNIITEKFDSTEKVTIYGNEELKTGTNKILVNVTAEDGSTKFYRIYVTKKTAETKTTGNTISNTGEIKSNTEETLNLHTTYYLSEVYAKENQYINKGENILKYTNGTYLTAPYNLVVTELNIPNENEIITSKHSISVKGTDILQTSLTIGEDDLNKIKVGQEAQISISALNNKEYTGYVTNISNTGNYSSNGSKFTVVVEFENDGEILIGMTGKTKVILEK